MAHQPPLYQSFYLRPSAAQRNVNALVSAPWHRLFPGQQNHRLDEIFARMAYSPELATLHICPYYFDQVTYHLPTRNQVKHMEGHNLRLHCFDTWADLKREQEWAKERQRRSLLRTEADREAQCRRGMNLNRLCQFKDPNTDGSISTGQYIYLMYGYRC